MAGQDDTSAQPGSRAEPTGEPKPFGQPPSLHREPPIITGEAIVPKREESFETDAANASDAATDRPPGPTEPTEPSPDDLNPDQPPPGVTSEDEPRPARLSPATLALVVLASALAGLAGGALSHLFFADPQKAVAPLDERISALDAKLSSDEKKFDALAGGNRDALGALDKRLTAAQKAADDAKALAGTALTQAQAAQTAASSQPSGAAQDLSPLQSNIDALGQRLAQVETAINAPKAALRAPQDREAGPAAQTNDPAIAIVTEDLLRKISSGAAYADDIAGLRRLGVEQAKFADLQPFADHGVATAQALADEFKALAPKLIATEKPKEQGSVFERVLAHAASLVRIRRVDDLSGDDPSTRIARIEAALAHDDTPRALAGWDALSDETKQASAHWAEAAKARARAIAAAQAIASETMARLTKIKS